MNAEEKQILTDLFSLSFALDEVRLYLDAYPSSKEALAYYRETKEKLFAAEGAYEEAFGPLTAFSDRNDQSWDWVETPFPWESEAPYVDL